MSAVMSRTAVFALCALTLLLVALSTGGEIYYLLLGMMGAMLALSIMSVLLVTRTVRVRFRAEHTRLIRGEETNLSLTIWHAGVFPVAFLRVTLASSEGGVIDVLDVHAPPLRQTSLTHAVPCPHRGVYSIGVAQVQVADVFGLFQLTRKIQNCTARLEVAPRLLQEDALPVQTAELGPERIARMTDDTASPSDVRAYREGDELKKVHWKLTMRKREVMVRTYEETARPDTLIVMDTSPVSALPSQALGIQDALCECAAAAVYAQLGEDDPVRMPLMGRRPTEPTGQSRAEFQPFLDALTRVSFTSPYSYEQVLALVMRRMQRTGGLVLITAKLTLRIADVAIQMRRMGMQVKLLWVTDSRRAEGFELMARLEVQGVDACRVNPWEGDLGAEAQRN